MAQDDVGGSGSAGAASGGQGRSPAQNGGERPPAPGIDIEKPHVARMYDYFLGGKNNYAADREAAEQVLKAMPLVQAGARMNRWLLVESVRWLAQEAGIRQFLDIGSGLPTQQNVHEVAQSVDKNARVVYVDNDPLVRVHAESLLATTPNTIVVEGDLREPEALLGRPELREHLDFSRPLALLLVAVLHFIEDTQRAYEIAQTLYDALPSGSYVVLSHALTDPVIEEGMAHTRAIYSRTNSGGFPRTRDEIKGFFTGLTPVGSGLAHATEWSLPGRTLDLLGDGNIVPVGDPSALQKLPVMFGVARVDR